MTTRILLIDKKPESIEDIREKLSHAAGQWELEICTNLRNVLKSIRADPPDIVICAHRPSVIDGVKKLKSIGTHFPHIERYVLALEKNKEALASGIGSAFHFLPCPCPQTTLQLELQRFVTLNDWLGRDRIKGIVSSVSDFPSLPTVYMKVVDAVNSPDASVESIAEIITGDIAVTAKILQTVNSSYYGLEEKVSDITEAISILGLESIKNIVLAIQAFSRVGDTAQQATVDKLWRHSMSVAVAAKRIAKHEARCEKKAEEAYTAGLFHDIGKLVLLKSSPEKYIEAQTRAEESKMSQTEAENEIFGCNHAEVGAYILGRWGLPVNIIEAAALHHKPSESFNSGFTALSAVHAANVIVWGRSKSESPSPNSRVDDDYLAEIGCVGSWKDWEHVAVGKEPEKKISTAEPSGAEGEDGVQSTDTVGTPVPFEDPKNEGKNFGRNRALVILTAAATIVGGIVLFTPSPRIVPQSEVLANAQDDWDSGSLATDTNSRVAVEISEVEEPAIAETESESGKDLEGTVAFDNSAADLEEPPLVDAVEIQDQETAVVAQDESALEVVSKRPQIRLTGIFFNDSNPLASINGKLLRPGDVVEGARVLAIEERFVTVRYEGETLQINLPK